MHSDQCISVTDLRRKTGTFIGKDTYAEQFVFVGSKPTNVLLTMKRYEELRKIEAALYEQDLDLHFIPYEKLSQEEQEKYNTARAKDRSCYVSI
ncbi:MAG: hypothetical protein PHH70_02110 [Candidatus Gracilibacteria bacterium]|nr:hypothetical protein [Candidatus Gracilibacteria bacterium]